MNKIPSRIIKHPDFTPSDKNIKIWRYMDFSKYVSLLNNSSLFFSRPDLLGDPHEGSWPREILDQYENRIMSGFQKLYENAKKCDPDIDESKFMSIPSMLQAVRDIRLSTRSVTFINCWHINEDENEQMWKGYGGEGYSIAIQSTYHKLEECFYFSINKDDQLVDWATMGRVNYTEKSLDKMLNPIMFAPYLNKRKEYRSEEEFRAIIFKPPPSGQNIIPGLYFPVNLNNLIESVIISPNSPEWFLSLVKDITNKYGFSEFVIKPSSLSAEPTF